MNNLNSVFTQGFYFHQQGRLQEARQMYEAVLKVQPNHADALHLLGVIATQTGQAQIAVELIGKAITINKNNPGFYINHGNALQSLNQLEAAVVSFDRAIQLNSNIPDAFFNRGNALYALNQCDAAIVSFSQAIKIKPDYAEAYNNRGRAEHALEKFEAALSSFDLAIQFRPQLAEAYNNRGITLHAMNRMDEAVENYQQSIRLRPDYAEAHNNLGIVLGELKQYELAMASLKRAIEIRPTYAEAFNNLGNIYQAIKCFESAVDFHKRAISIKPNYAEAWNDLGNALYGDKQFYEAVVAYERAIDLKVDFSEAYNNRGNALQEIRQFDDAVASYQQATKIRPDYPEAWNNLGNAFTKMNRLDGAAISYEMALKICPNYDYLPGILLHTRAKLCDWRDYDQQLTSLVVNIEQGSKVASCFPVMTLVDSLTVQRRAAEIYVADKYPPNDSLGSIPSSNSSQRIRIGYFSADFHNHATTWLMAELFEHHDRSRFELFAFSFGPNRHDDMRVRIMESFDEFIDVRANTDEEVARLARAKRLDIAVDLKGYTQDGRLGIFAYRAAPVQVGFLGYPGTVGADYIDYLIADRTVIPEASQCGYVEKIAYLPNSYQVNDRKRKISTQFMSRAQVGLPESAFVFCCFNANYKITPAVFDRWMRILLAVPGSVLWLLQDNLTAASNLRKEAEVRGVNPERIVFANKIDLPDHLARHRLADLFLDTLPCNAHTTASDALWAGLPVLTQKGEGFASRVAASLLNAIRIPELITETGAQYEALAIELATQAEKLKAVKTKLQQNRLTTPLFDSQQYTRDLESVYVDIYKMSLS